MEIMAGRPPLVADLGNRIAAGDEQLPKLLQACGGRKPARRTDDRDRSVAHGAETNSRELQQPVDNAFVTSAVSNALRRLPAPAMLPPSSKLSVEAFVTEPPHARSFPDCPRRRSSQCQPQRTNCENS